MTTVADALTARTDAMVDELRLLVEHETPTGDVERLDALADVLDGQWEDIGARVMRHREPGVGDHLELTWHGPDGTPTDVAPALLLGHYDTVHDVGTLDRNPWRVDDDGRAWGPGSQDMKSGLVIMRHALAALADHGRPLPRPVTVLITADEEVGSTTSRDLIRARGRAADHALVFEGSMPSGAVKTSRKGVGLWSVTVTGTAAHAGQHFFDGVNAIVALARLIPDIAALSDREADTTVNIGVVRGGTRTNVVAEHARADIDVRFADDAEADRVAAALDDLTAPATAARTPYEPEAVTVRVDGGINRPAMPRTAATAALFDRARACARELGVTLEEAAAGGASDGNLTAAEGVPTLDGLGGVGAGLHTDDEYVHVWSLPQRAALLAALLSSTP